MNGIPDNFAGIYHPIHHENYVDGFAFPIAVEAMGCAPFVQVFEYLNVLFCGVLSIIIRE